MITAFALLAMCLVGLALWAGADTITASFNTIHSGTHTKDVSGRATATAWQVGQNSFPSLSKSYTTGTGTNQVNKEHVSTYSIGATTNQDLDLSGVLTDDQGNTLAFTYIKEILVIINDPDGTKALEIGPAGVSNAFLGPFADASDKLTFLDHIRLSNPYTGWAVTGGTVDIMRLRNPSASALTATVVILGI